jgi:uncharacterized membrane protein (UPF0127 family)
MQKMFLNLTFCFTTCCFANDFCLPQTFGNDRIPVQIAIADTEKARALGLMYHQKLCPDEGLLMVFEQGTCICLWAKNVYQDLDVAFLDKNYQVLSIQSLKCDLELNAKLKQVSEKEDEIEQAFLKQQIRGPEHAVYALEMSEGFFTRHEIHLGDFLVWNRDQPTISKIRVLRQKAS